ncbi:MAG: hypothetical protein H6810_02675 [Phycisphaeraceae bacterium]|nr:MAG: hypothetical protein H6810_02675 [Phycisphaeraceae bacterium]
MKRDATERDQARFFDDLAKRIELDEHEPADPAPLPGDDPVVHELVRSFLMWEAPRPGVPAALAKLRESVVDFNELRVSLCEETAMLLGSRYPLARERCLRLRAALKEVFLRENGLTLVHLRDEPKRAARAYFDSLPGITGFVAARVALLSCEAHAFPLDSVLCDVLKAAGVVEKDCDTDTASARLERAIRAGDALGCYRRLERFALEKPQWGGGKKPKSSRTSSSKAAGKA